MVKIDKKNMTLQLFLLYACVREIDQWKIKLISFL